MKDFIFISGNQHKADYLAKWLGRPVNHQKLDLDEIQSLDVRVVTERKVHQAYALLRRPVLVEDVALTFEAMGKLPGPLIKWFLQELDTAGLCVLARSLEHQKAVASICYAWFDGEKLCFFEHDVRGTIAPEPRGEAWGWNPIFIPEGAAKTYAEMTDDEVRPYSMRAQAIEALRDFVGEPSVSS